MHTQTHVFAHLHPPFEASTILSNQTTRDITCILAEAISSATFRRAAGESRSSVESANELETKSHENCREGMQRGDGVAQTFGLPMSRAQVEPKSAVTLKKESVRGSRTSSKEGKERKVSAKQEVEWIGETVAGKDRKMESKTPQNKPDEEDDGWDRTANEVEPYSLTLHQRSPSSALFPTMQTFFPHVR
ncbi:unnamed protein product [Protopolystoma xenopodis]|uniref:Uncharacterized protein n=1 Tax=Protopolystoma xenopodis TaxID=117903 RepID=A0A448XDT7_9PLAT|nr:unnamed protein product [Protopolystoma xenopodis]